jgi:hypothetical protein
VRVALCALYMRLASTCPIFRRYVTTGYVPLAEAEPTHGGEAASLRWLIEHGYPVPAGIVVGAADAHGLGDWIAPDRRYAVRSFRS